MNSVTRHFNDFFKNDGFGKVFLVANLVFSQFFFLILISYVGKEGHILGEIGYRICQFLITNFLGVSAFAIPLSWFYLFFSLLKKHRNISAVIRHTVWFSAVFFWFNTLLLNTSFINTPWAGLLPKFTHAIISKKISGNFDLNPLVIGLEAGLMLLSIFLLTASYLNQSYLSMMKAVKSTLTDSWKFICQVFQSIFHWKTGDSKKSGIIQSFNLLKGKWRRFWENIFDFIDRVDDDEIKEYLGDKPSALTSSGFTFVRIQSSSQISAAVVDRQPNEKPPISSLDKISQTDTFSLDTTPSEEDEALQVPGWGRQTTPFRPESNDITKNDQEIIDLSWKNFFNEINGEYDLEESINSPETDSKGNLDYSEENEKLNKDKPEEVIPSVINSRNYHVEVPCLAAEEKLVFSKNPSRSKTLDIEIKNTSEKLESTIKEFGINTQVVHVSQGPVITQYELTLEPGVHINRIVNLSDNIALALAAESVRIVAPIPGKAVIGIEIPNKAREMVTLRDIVNKSVFKEFAGKLPIALGASVSGKPVITDLTATPHLLVAGATGSGKSVCVNSIICSLLLRRTPEQVRFLMIDPKMVELNIYNGIPHLLAPVITDPQKAALTLKWAISEMDARYRLLEKFGVRNISSYNQMVENKKNCKYGSLPYIVIIIDEFADLMMVARKEIEDSVSRLAAMSRAIGIHLLLATQRPSVDVITGVIKANFPSRIAFQVSSKIDSRTIIDSMGAEKLLGKGDMLYQNAATGNPYRIQGTFLSDEEVREIVSDLRNKEESQYVLNLHDEMENQNSDGLEFEDEIFNAAVEIAKKEGKISTSLIQRRLRIGYNRAARVVELMEEKGIVGASDGVRPREVLVSNR